MIIGISLYIIGFLLIVVACNRSISQRRRSMGWGFLMAALLGPIGVAIWWLVQIVKDDAVKRKH